MLLEEDLDEDTKAMVSKIQASSKFMLRLLKGSMFFFTLPLAGPGKETAA